MEWTREDSRAAMLEGWDVFWADRGGDESCWEIQRLDCPDACGLFPEGQEPLFSDDSDVWRMLRESESPLHQKALEFIKEHSPSEYKLVMWKED